MKNLSHWTRLSPLFFNPFPYTGPALVLSARPLRRAGRQVPSINLRPDQRQDVPATKSNVEPKRPPRQDLITLEEKNCNLFQASRHNPTV